VGLFISRHESQSCSQKLRERYHLWGIRIFIDVDSTRTRNRTITIDGARRRLTCEPILWEIGCSRMMPRIYNWRHTPRPTEVHSPCRRTSSCCRSMSPRAPAKRRKSPISRKKPEIHRSGMQRDDGRERERVGRISVKKDEGRRVFRNCTRNVTLNPSIRPLDLDRFVHSSKVHYWDCLAVASRDLSNRKLYTRTTDIISVSRRALSIN